MVEACADPWVHALMVVRVPALRRGRFAATWALRCDAGASLATVALRLWRFAARGSRDRPRSTRPVGRKLRCCQRPVSGPFTAFSLLFGGRPSVLVEPEIDHPRGDDRGDLTSVPDAHLSAGTRPHWQPGPSNGQPALSLARVGHPMWSGYIVRADVWTAGDVKSNINRVAPAGCGSYPGHVRQGAQPAPTEV